MKKLNVIFYAIITALAGGVCFLLLIQSLFTDIKLGQGELIFFVASNKFVVLVCTILFLILFYLWHRHILLSDKAVRRIIMLMSVVNCVCVFGSQNMPRADQGRVLEFATQIWEGNYEIFYPGSYMDMCPHQNGIVLFGYLLCIAVGGYNFLAFQILNALAVNYTYYLIYKFWKKYGAHIRIDEIMIGIGLFFPITLTVNYVYGTIIGLAFAVWAILYQQAYLKDRNYKNMIFSILFVSLACVFKSNFMIFLIGIVLVYLYDMIIHKRKESIVGVICIIFCVIIFNGIVDKSLSIITDGASDKVEGIPAVAYVVMGLKDTERYGWYNGYNASVYQKNDNNSEKTKQVCLDELESIIEQKSDDPKGTIDFFQHKIASTWCESSFGSFYNNRMDYQTTLRGHSGIYNDFFADTGRLHRLASLFLETYQNIIYLGVLLYLWYNRKDRNVTVVSGIIIFLGGFIFHLFWEVKSSYAFIYFVLLIPYAIMGLTKCFDNIGSDGARVNRIKGICTIFAIGVVVVVIGSLVTLKEDNEDWNIYLSEHRYISDGYYYVKPIEFDGVCRYVEGEGIVVIEDALKENDKLYLSLDMSDTWQYQFDDSSRKNALTVVEDNIYMLSNEQKDALSATYQRWRIERIGGGYCIRWWRDMNKVLTFDEQTMTVYLSDYKEENRAQIWELSKR